MIKKIHSVGLRLSNNYFVYLKRTEIVMLTLKQVNNNDEFYNAELTCLIEDKEKLELIKENKITQIKLSNGKQSVIPKTKKIILTIKEN